ncbi:MAG: DUF3500 domain-containing protein [Chloroflexi bacterium]|nr:DUF3500 domain-containing protein [Chloroflexota bacterium]
MATEIQHGHAHAAAASDITGAAKKFLASLSGDQKAKAMIEYTKGERFFWYYPQLNRQGLPLRDMNDSQRELAMNVIKTTMSEEGYNRSKLIMELEDILGPLEAEEDNVGWERRPDLYYWTIFGEPGGDGPWAWRVEGHHISVQFSIWGDNIIASTPFFFGANPAEVPKGPKQGQRVLHVREDTGFELLNSLDASQRVRAIVHEKAPWDIYTYNATRPSLPEGEGLPASEMTGSQREILMSLIAEYVNQVRGEFADQKMAEIQKKGIDDFFFSWHGGTTRADKHYYRIHGGTFVVEFDNFQNDANHIHSVIRDVNNDFANDVIREHRIMYHID